MMDVTRETETEGIAEIPIREKKPTFWKGLFFLIVIGVIMGGLGAFALSQRSEAGPLVATDAPIPISVRVAEVAMTTNLSLEEKFTGIATARRTSALGFQTGGRITSINVDVGSVVSAGQTLAKLDTRALQAQLNASLAVVDEARAGRDLAATTVQRQRTLQARGHVSQQRVDEAQAQVDTATARIAAANAQADTLRVQIDLARLTAPFAGVITQRQADEGAIAAPGVPVLELVERGHIEARIGLPAKQAAELEPGRVYTLLSDQGPVEAKLRASTGVIDASRRTVPAIFDITEPDKVAIGAVIRLAMEREIDEAGFWVPVGALTESSRGLWSIYTLAPKDGGWVAAPRLVEIVHSEGDRAYVRGAFNEGDRYITDGLQRLTPGQAVTPGLTVARE